MNGLLDAWRSQPAYVRHTVKVLGAALVAFIVANQLNALREDPWVDAASVAELRGDRVVYLPEHQVFVVWDAGAPLALSADARHLEGERVLFCPSSGQFESPAHGEKFDLGGRYVAGPAASDMTRVASRLEGDRVLVNPSMETASAARGERGAPRDPEGPICVTDRAPAEGAPGFYAG